jgi:hypothetical protein
MKLVEAHIAKRQAEFTKHEFFSENRLGSGSGSVISFAPDLTFWVMAFQDVLRLNAALTKDPKIRKIVRHHRAEDAGHDRWFLDDLSAMQIPAPDVRWLFGERHKATRDSTYMLVSECYRTTDDRMRLVLVQTLESAGHIFFGKVAEAVEKAGWTKLLKYFSFSHLEVEKSHEVFEAEIAKTISAIRFDAKARAEAKQLVDRCYTAFTTMFDALCAASDRQIVGMTAGFVAPAPAQAHVTAQAQPRPPAAGVGISFVAPPPRHPRTRTQA